MTLRLFFLIFHYLLLLVLSVSAKYQFKIAFCLTGQLVRLELYSKIVNILLPNAKRGYLTHLYVFLDNEVEEVKQTYWNYDYSLNLFGSYSRQQLKAYIDRKIENFGFSREDDGIRTRVKLQPPPRHKFAVVHDKVPVDEKLFSGHDGPKDNREPAESRFQNNIRWMAGLRECAKWVQTQEQQQGWFYDLVVRLREDTFAFGPWILSPERYKGALSSLQMGSFHGINDHNFVLDRFWLDDLYRGLTEDYYFNSTLDGQPWHSPEKHIMQMAAAYNIPVRFTSICDQPLIPHRGMVNNSHWRLHPLYIRHVHDECSLTGSMELARQQGYSNMSLHHHHYNNNNNDNNDNDKQQQEQQQKTHHHRHLTESSADDSSSSLRRTGDARTHDTGDGQTQRIAAAGGVRDDESSSSSNKSLFQRVINYAKQKQQSSFDSVSSLFIAAQPIATTTTTSTIPPSINAAMHDASDVRTHTPDVQTHTSDSATRNLVEEASETPETEQIKTETEKRPVAEVQQRGEEEPTTKTNTNTRNTARAPTAVVPSKSANRPTSTSTPPTRSPTSSPTVCPTTFPPSHVPTVRPTVRPTNSPILPPTKSPTKKAPTSAPTTIRPPTATVSTQQTTVTTTATTATGKKQGIDSPSSSSSSTSSSTGTAISPQGQEKSKLGEPPVAKDASKSVSKSGPKIVPSCCPPWTIDLLHNRTAPVIF